MLQIISRQNDQFRYCKQEVQQHICADLINVALYILLVFHLRSCFIYIWCFFQFCFSFFYIFSYPPIYPCLHSFSPLQVPLWRNFSIFLHGCFCHSAPRCLLRAAPLHPSPPKRRKKSLEIHSLHFPPVTGDQTLNLSNPADHAETGCDPLTNADDDIRTSFAPPERGHVLSYLHSTRLWIRFFFLSIN